MLNVGVRARFLLMIGLGLTIGLSLITLPGVLVGHQNNSVTAPRTSTNSTGGTTATNPATTSSVTIASPSNTTKTQSTASETGLTITALSILVALMVIPALTLAFLTSTWASRRRRNTFKDESIGEAP